MAYISSNLVPGQSMSPTTQQGLRALGAVRAGLVPNIAAYKAANPIQTMPSYQATPARTPLSSPAGQTQVSAPVSSQSPTQVSNYKLPDGTYYSGDSGGLQGAINKASQTPPSYANPEPPTPGAGGTAMTGIPATSGASFTGANQGTQVTFPGLVSDLVAKTQGIYSQQAGLSKQAQDTLKTIADQEAALTGGSYSGTAADYSGRMAQLENLKQNVIQAQAAQQQALAAQEQPLVSAYGAAIGATQPQLGAYGQAYYQPLQAGQTPSGQYGTGPAAAANVQSIQEQTKAVNDYSAARTSAQNLTGQLNSLITSKGINPSDLNAVNRFIQGIMGQTSSPEYQTFSNLVQDLAARYAQVLTPAGGDTTNMVRSIAQSLINATASGKSIQSVLDSLDSQAQSVISGYQKNVQALQTGGNVNPAAGGTPSGAPLTWNDI